MEIKIDEEEYSRNFNCKVFAEIPHREIDMDFKHSMPNATQVFEEKSHNCCSKVVGNHVMDVRRQNKAELSCLFCVQYSYEDSKKAFANQLF
ncbi:hypothetical protein H5410_033894 [Solanum commersonii]|uniref:Uncharacterized protein n=1 Tax=Solanum commersonii TaxID=4109 RepID=A0A9J5YTY2_SOLCO|nr:hypothetical protein H5410_033894 [Solanum commersonii]